MATEKKLFTNEKSFLESPPATTCTDVINMAVDAADVLAQVRERIMEPFPRKKAPMFTAFQVSHLLGMDRTKLRVAEARIGSTRGFIPKVDGADKPQNFKTYSLKETIELAQEIGNFSPRPGNKTGKVIAIASYKGGVSKTTTAVTIAMGLSLKGYKTLLVDLDGQGSATSLMGVSPEVEVDYDDTLMPFIHGEQPDLSYAVQKTYWHHLDLIPASSSLLSAEFVIPSRSKDEYAYGYHYWKQLEIGLSKLKQEYDVIVLDTSPSLGYLTQNSLVAADMIFSPCPQGALDFASLTQFWGVFAEMATNLPEFISEKSYDCVEIFITRAQSDNNELAASITGWIKGGFGAHLSNISIPESSIPQKAASEMKTVYEITGKDYSSSAYKRYREPIDKFVDHVVEELILAWRR